MNGRRPSTPEHDQAASIISRSASGSATLPNADSTCQRRASQPSTWSVSAATREDDAGRPAVAAVGVRHEHDEDGDEREPQDRERVRQGQRCGHGGAVVYRRIRAGRHAGKDKSGRSRSRRQRAARDERSRTSAASACRRSETGARSRRTAGPRPRATAPAPDRTGAGEPSTDVSAQASPARW